MRFLTCLLFDVSFILAQKCDLCPLPNMDMALLAPCINSGDFDSCCTYGRLLAEDPCVRVWLYSPLLTSYWGLIRELKTDCNIRDLGACNETVAEACPDQCADVNATLETADMMDNNATENDDDMMDKNAMEKDDGMMNDGKPLTSGSEMPPQQCMKEGEQFTPCQSSSCFEATCVMGQLNKPGPICTTDCKKGCRCMDGWARDSFGSCITEEECGEKNDTECGLHEEFEDCGSSSCWEPHCQDGKVITPGPMCTFDCRQGCKCSSGFVRDRRVDACIPEQLCTQGKGKVGKGKFGKGKKGKMLVGKNGNTP
jgi:hypothetical protein